MGEGAFGGREEVRAASVGSGEGDAGGDGRPAGEGWALEMEEQEDPAEEAFDTGAFAEFVERPGGWQEWFFVRLGFQGRTARAPKTVWVQRMRASPQ